MITTNHVTVISRNGLKTMLVALDWFDSNLDCDLEVRRFIGNRPVHVYVRCKHMFGISRYALVVFPATSEEFSILVLKHGSCISEFDATDHKVAGELDKEKLGTADDVGELLL